MSGKPTSIDNFHAELAPQDRLTCEKLRAVIDDVLDLAESKIWHAHPVWFLDGNPIVGYSKLKDGVRLMFWSGQSFSSPGLKASGNFKAGEQRFAGVDDINEESLRKWLSESRTIQWDYKNIAKRKGRLEPIGAWNS